MCSPFISTCRNFFILKLVLLQPLAEGYKEEPPKQDIAWETQKISLDPKH